MVELISNRETVGTFSVNASRPHPFSGGRTEGSVKALAGPSTMRQSRWGCMRKESAQSIASASRILISSSTAVTILVEALLPVTQLRASSSVFQTLDCSVLATLIAMMKRGEVKVGNIVAIFGVGGLGINAMQMAKAFGAAKVIALDRKEAKRELALAVGADEAIDLDSPNLRKELLTLSGGEGVDVALEFIGLDSTIEKTIECVRRGGKAVIVGVYTGSFRVKAHPLVVKEIDIRGVWTVLQQEFPDVIELVRAGKIDLSKSITHRLPLEEVNRGLEVLEKKIGNPLRIVIIP